MKNNIKKKIILSGGGTGGSVTPLLYIYKDLKNEFDFLFVGTYKGIEKSLVSKEGIAFKAILSGKWRRYFSFHNFLDLFIVFLAFWQSLFLIIKERPSLVISAGGFVAVPLSFAAYFLKVPIIIHQQDIVPGLANKLMSIVSTKLTVSFSSSLEKYGKKAILIGNLGPDLREDSINIENIYIKYGIKKNFPILLCLGGGTGSLFLNKIINESASSLVDKFFIIHISGSQSRDLPNIFNHNNYLKLEFIDHKDLINLFIISNIVVSRCGLATLTELSFLSKPSILIPMPNSHQEFNALEFKKNNAAIILNQENLNSEKFINEVIILFSNKSLLETLSKNIKNVIKRANDDMLKIIKDLI